MGWATAGIGAALFGILLRTYWQKPNGVILFGVAAGLFMAVASVLDRVFTDTTVALVAGPLVGIGGAVLVRLVRQRMSNGSQR